MKSKIIKTLGIWFSCLLLMGCVSSHVSKPEELETPLPKLTLATQAVFLYPEAGKAVSDKRLVREAMKNKPELRRVFKGIPVKVQHADRNIVLLVCSPDGKSAWLEDASWTPGVDRKWYTNNPPPPARFTLDPTVRPALN